MTTKKYNSLSEFYPFYLSEHQDTTSRVLHFIGTGLFFTIVIYVLVTGRYTALLFGPIAGYGFAWVGHFFFEKNTWSSPKLLYVYFQDLTEAASKQLRIDSNLEEAQNVRISARRVHQRLKEERKESESSDQPLDEPSLVSNVVDAESRQKRFVFIST